MYKVLLSPSSRQEKKLMVRIYKNNRRIKTIHFGQKGYEDYTIHHDENRKKKYIKRHQVNQDWDNFFSAGFWSRWILWNKPTITESAKDTENEFGIKIYLDGIL